VSKLGGQISIIALTLLNLFHICLQQKRGELL